MRVRCPIVTHLQFHQGHKFLKRVDERVEPRNRLFELTASRSNPGIVVCWYYNSVFIAFLKDIPAYKDNDNAGQNGSPRPIAVANEQSEEVVPKNCPQGFANSPKGFP